MRTIRRLLVFIPLVFLLTAAVFPAPKGFVNDFAGVLDQDAKARLEDRLTAYERGTSNEIAIALFQSLGGRTIEDLAASLFEEWKIGKRDKNNGILIVAAIQDRKVRIEVGYGLEGRVPDAQAGRIIREAIAPRFREGRYADGLEAAVDGLTSLIGSAPAAPAPSQPNPPNPSAPPTPGLLDYLESSPILIIIIVAAVLFGVYQWVAGKRCPRCGTRMYSSADVSITGTVGEAYTAAYNICPKCRYQERERWRRSGDGHGAGWDSGWDTGGFWWTVGKIAATVVFSGFGGGSSGGGGASGSW